MRALQDARPHVKAFIAYAREDDEEAKHYKDLLEAEGFTVYKFADSNSPGEKIDVAKEISECDFFLLLISPYSASRPWIQRELGFAVQIQQALGGGYRPLIIPILTSHHRTDTFPRRFRMRDFHTGKLKPDLDLTNRQGIDRHARRSIDFDKKLLESMKPGVLVTRLDFSDEHTFNDTKALDLYEELFPQIERDNRNDIVKWVLHDDVGKARYVKLSADIQFDYRLDSRYFIMMLAQRAIGIAFLTYDYKYNFLYGNYIAVERHWRNFQGLGDSFIKKIEEIAIGREMGKDEMDHLPLFPNCKGVIFEVERFDRDRVEKIVTDLENSKAHVVATEADRDQIRRFLRVSWYQKLGFKFFLDGVKKEPLVCVAPCLDPSETPREDWMSEEESYWLMWQPRRGGLHDLSAVDELWQQAVRSVYIEVLAKSLVERFSDTGAEYWEYANDIVTDTLRYQSNRNIVLGTYLHRRENDLHRRWSKLGIDIAI
jgi:hypothetical protein